MQSIMMLPLLFIMWNLTNKMPRRKGTESNIQLSIIVLFTGIYHVLQIFGVFENVTLNGEILGDVLFLAILFALYQIFHNTQRWEQWLVYIGCLVTGLVVFFIPLPVLHPILSIILGAAAWYYLVSDMHRKAKIAIVLFTLSKMVVLAKLFWDLPSSELLIGLITISAYTIIISYIVDYLLQLIRGTYESSIQDPLTGLYNRKQFTAFVNKSIDKEIRVNVIFLDVDNFKQLNDVFGHKKGDEVLKKVASILLEELEGIGVAGRYGGEEMVGLIVDPHIDMLELTESIRSRIEHEASFDTPEGTYSVTASIGYSSYVEGLSSDELIKQADEAMYAAKKSGKNQVVEYGKYESSTMNVSDRNLTKVGIM